LVSSDIYIFPLSEKINLGNPSVIMQGALDVPTLPSGDREDEGGNIYDIH
jgi:hypothetical protein